MFQNGQNTTLSKRERNKKKKKVNKAKNPLYTKLSIASLSYCVSDLSFH